MNILLILKGILIGIGKIIPGVSGSVMAITLGIYNKAIRCVTHFFDDVMNNFRYLLYLGIGIVLGIVFFSRVILYLIINYNFYVMMLFIGLIFGGCISIYKDSKKGIRGILFIILGFLFMSIFGFISSDFEYLVQGNFYDYVVYFVAGIFEGIGTIIPGISSTALLMILGVYDIFLNNISNVLDIFYVLDNIYFYIFFSLGLFISVISSIYLVYYLFNRHRGISFSFILGIVLSNILFLFINILGGIIIKDLIIGVLLLGLGIIISILIDI